LAVKNDKTLYAWGKNDRGQLGDGTLTNRSVRTLIGNNYSQIAAGGYHSLSIISNDFLWTWGANNFNQLGDGAAADKSLPTFINQ
jgi:alpha-tubulin suppressor-like RCC1 family protein